MASKRAILEFLFRVVSVALVVWSSDEEKQALLDFLHFPGVGVRGNTSIGRLSSLQVLSLRANRISSPFPSDFDKLASFRSIYLQSNDFSAHFPLDFSVWKNLTLVGLSSNRFNGTIPLSRGNLTHLSSLNLSRNRLSGRIPDLGLPNLQGLDLSYNNLPGNMIGRLSSLQVLSLRANRISVPFPSDFDKLLSLTSIYIQSNDFSGHLPLDFSVWKNLTVVDLSRNQFIGTIPLARGNLTQLSSFNLLRNRHSGRIPDLCLPGLQELDLSDNNLAGSMPRLLKRFPRAFSGNNVTSDIAVPPSLLVKPSRNVTQPARNLTKKLIKPALSKIAIGGCVMAFEIIALLMLVIRSNIHQNGVVAVKQKKAISVSEMPDEINRLFFFDGCSLAFDLDDLLRASVEFLGKGLFGMTYKAVLEDAGGKTTTLVEKQLKEVTVANRDFEKQIEIVGAISHENVVPLRAYYSSKVEKVIVCDYYEQGSVSSMLHGGRGQGRTAMDWETRLRMATGAARGIAHIHTKNRGKLVHGNIKASNTFLNAKGYGCVSDVGLATLLSPVVRSAGYRAPEASDSRKATTASDVYSLGVLIFELLTGKSPMHLHATVTEQVVHLVRWVNSTVREERTMEVFDAELLRYPNIEEELIRMLQLGMTCVARLPEKRPKISVVVAGLEEIQQVGSGNYPSEVGTPVATPVTE